MANGGETSRRALKNKTEEYYRNLRQACKSGSDRRKEEIATLMAERIYEKVVFPLLERLATDTHICKIQAIRTIGKVKNPNEDVLRILLSLLNDHDTKIRYEATRIIVNFIEVDFVYGELAVQMGISVLDLAEKLLSGPHESKMQALEIYKRNWKSNPSRVIQDLEKKLNQEEKDDYIAFKGMMNLFGEIGKCYPKRITRILKDLLFDEEIRDEVYISSILEGIAENHPNEILELLEGVTDNRNIYSKKVIPDLLQFTAEKSPERTFELLKRLATDDHKSIRHRVLESLEHFQNQFPDYTLDVLQRLWQKAEDEIETRKENRDISQDLIPRNVKDMHPMQERIRSRF
ncbi:MAG: HEAT repeat domain-containing protein, partial [Theionarchaea archaeon]|nr:HEAT repeat domain-containing protein [Theionarchaea archaeon]